MYYHILRVRAIPTLESTVSMIWLAIENLHKHKIMYCSLGILYMHTRDTLASCVLLVFELLLAVEVKQLLQILDDYRSLDSRSPL